jgi:hypothetical protein
MTTKVHLVQDKVIYNVDLDKQVNVVIYLLIFFIVLFLTHMVYSIGYCKKFSWVSFSLLIIGLCFSALYFSIQCLRMKVIRVGNSTSNKSVGTYGFQDDARVDLYIWTIGLSIFFISLLSVGIYKKDIMFGCSSTFPWPLLSIPLVTIVILMLKGLVTDVSHNKG